MGVTFTCASAGLAASKPVARLARVGIKSLQARRNKSNSTIYAVAAPMDMPATQEAAPRFEVRIKILELAAP